MPILCPATYTFAGTAKPIMVAALVTGAGVTAFATPLSDTAVHTRVSDFSVRTQSAGAGIVASSRLGTEIGTDVGMVDATPLAPSDVENAPVERVAPPVARFDRLPGVAPIDFVLEERPETAGIAAINAKPAFEATPARGYMPAAELRAMMAGVAASRGDLDGLARPDVAITIERDEDKLAGEPAFGKTSAGIDFEAAALVNGAPAGRVPLRIADGESISIKLGDVLGALQPLMDGATYEALASSQAAGEYVTFDTLRASGIPVSFDAQDRVIFGSS